MRYLVRERLFSITDDFWITDDRGDKIFLVDGKALRLRETFELKDQSGQKLATIHKRFITFTDAMEIEHDGEVVATVHKAVISPLHHRSHIDVRGGDRLEAVGNIIDKDFEIRDGRQAITDLPGLVPGPRHLRRRDRAGRERRSYPRHGDLPGPHPPRRGTPALALRHLVVREGVLAAQVAQLGVGRRVRLTVLRDDLRREGLGVVLGLVAQGAGLGE